MSQGFPIIINSRGATKLQIEFENVSQALVKNGKNNGEVIVIAENNKIANKQFTLQVDEAMTQTLKQSQESADNTGIPSIFPATIQSI